MKTKTLSVKNLVTLFGVTPMTIYTWRKGTTTRPALPHPPTPTKVTKWAKQNAVEMLCDPTELLGTDICKPGPKPKLTAPVKSTGAVQNAHDEAVQKPTVALLKLSSNFSEVRSKPAGWR